MPKTKNLQSDIDQFMNKIKKMEKGEQLDLSSDQDLSIAIMNLISIEEHLFFSYGKTKDSSYLDLLTEVREMRKSALKRIIKDYEGEEWCIGKHLLASSMRFMEVGTKALTKEDQKEAKNMFDKAYQLYSLFWGMNLGLVKTSNLKQVSAVDPRKITLIDEQAKPQKKASVSLLAKLGEVVKKAVDCCRE